MEFVMKQALGGATKDMGKMLGGDEEKDPDAAKKEEERQEALRQEEEERKAKYAKMEAEREAVRQGIRDKSEGSSWRTRVPPPLPAAPVTAQRFLQEDLVRRDERAWAPFPGPAGSASKPQLPDIPCCVTQDLRPDQGAPPPQLGTASRRRRSERPRPRPPWRPTRRAA
uniref:Complexin-1 n=1 Tax=Bos taurus TaxID=9913 RepID=A0AAA9SSP6_BOVIN